MIRTTLISIVIAFWPAYGAAISLLSIPTPEKEPLLPFTDELATTLTPYENPFAGPAPAVTAGLSREALAREEAALRQQVLADPQNPRPLHALGTVLFHEGYPEEALSVWANAAGREPNLAPADLMAAINRVYALLNAKDRAAADLELKSITKQFAANPHFHLMRAEQAMRSRNFAEADNSFKRAHELGPELFVTSLNLARFRDAMGQPETAHALYREATERAPERPEVWSYLGAFQFRQGDEEAALASLRQAHTLDPGRPVAEARLGALAAALGDYPAAAHWYQAALGSEPGNADIIRIALGDAQLRQGKLDEARETIQSVLERQELVPLLFALGTIEEAQGNVAAAESRYRRVLELAPDNVFANNNLAMLLVREGRAPEEALSFARQAYGILPDNGIVLGTYACALANARGEAASDLLERAITVVPEDPWVRFFYGRYLIERDAKDQARDQLRKVIELDSSFPRLDLVQSLMDGLE